jgi:hypothetical protein
MSPAIPKQGLVTDTEAMQIIKTYLEGCTMKKLMARSGRCYETIVRVFDSIKAKDLTTLTGLSEGKMAQIRKVYLSGECRLRVASLTGTPIGYVNLVLYGMKRPEEHRRVKKHATNPSPRRQVTPDERKDIVKLWDKGASKSEICRAMNRTEPTVRRILEEEGVFQVNEKISGAVHAWRASLNLEASQ